MYHEIVFNKKEQKERKYYINSFFPSHSSIFIIFSYQMEILSLLCE